MTDSTLPYVLLAAALAVPVYAYLVYPLLLMLGAAFRTAPGAPANPTVWPMVTVTIPVYNEAAVLRGKLERVLAYDYPRERLHVIVVSDASTDGTDDIAREFAARGVELVRLPTRSGKTAAENAALPYLRGEIVVNNDAAVRALPGSLKALVVWFGDPTVGVASGRDMSVSNLEREFNVGESGYVGYEMWLRRLETRVGGIIGASGCFYAMRRDLHQHLVPEALSRDFAAPLVAREHGFRSVSVDSAVVLVPRVPSLRSEYERKVRTMARGLETLFYKRHLMNPFRYGVFSWKLISHKLVRWLVPWALVSLVITIAWLARTEAWARLLLGLVGATALAALAGWWWPERRRMPRVVALPTYLVTGQLAALHAWIRALRRDLNPIWEPTRRGAAPP